MIGELGELANLGQSVQLGAQRRSEGLLGKQKAPHASGAIWVLLRVAMQL